jgi:hypothetical protein
MLYRAQHLFNTTQFRFLIAQKTWLGERRLSTGDDLTNLACQVKRKLLDDV